MTRLLTTTIPSAYVNIDTNASAVDSYANVHTMYTARQNHNSLAAQRIRKNLFTQASQQWEFKALDSVDSAGNAALLMSCPIYVTQLTRQVEVVMNACKTQLNVASTLALDPVLYAVVRHQYVDRYSNSYSATVAAGFNVYATYNITVDLPPVGDAYEGYYDGSIGYWLDVYAQCYLDTTHDLAAAQAITDVDTTWFVAATSAGAVGDAVHVDSDATSEPRKIIRRTWMGGANYKYWIDKPWSNIPDVSADTIGINEILGVRWRSFSLYELPLNEFDEDLAW